MKRFLLQSGLFFVSLLFFYYVMSLMASKVTMAPPENDFMAAMIDKHQRVKNIDSPTLIIAGGSNIAFNIESDKVQKNLGLPVVNLGLNIGLGISYMINEIDDLAEEGDIIFLFPTWYTAIEGTYPLQKYTAEHYPKSSEYFAFSLTEEMNIHLSDTRNQIRNIIVTFILEGAMRSVPDETPPLQGMYTREYFNKYGDFEGHHNLSPPDDLGQRLTYTYEYWEAIPVLNRFYDRMTQKGIHVFQFYPAYPITEWKKNRQVLEQYITDIENNLNIPQPISAKAFLLPEKYFFDTVFHLNKEGKEKRTDILIEKLTENPTFQNTLDSVRIGLSK